MSIRVKNHPSITRVEVPVVVETNLHENKFRGETCLESNVMWFETQESITHILFEISVELFKTPLSLSTTTTNARVFSITSYSLFLSQ